MSLNGLLKAVIPSLPLVSADKEVETLRMLPAETLFLALKEADTESALWVMENAKAAQVQGVLDLDCWKGDEFLAERFFRYFEYMTYTTPEKLLEYMKEIDPEVIVLALKEVVDVVDFDPQEPPEVEEERMLLTPDSKYALLFKTADSNLRDRLFHWCNKMSSVDIDLMRRHLESLKWENKNDLQEFGYQIKKARIEELGFVEREDALKFFSRISAPELRKQLLDHPLEKHVKEDSPLIETLGNEDFLPQPISKAVSDEGYFRKAMQHIENNHMLELLRMEVVRTVNAVFTAEDMLNEGLDPLRDSAARTRAYLDLGLLYLSGGDEKKAAEDLKIQSVFEVSRLGWTLVQDLNRAAAEVKKNFPLSLFESSEREFLNSLHGRHPQIQHPDVLRDLGLENFKYFTLETLHRCADQLGALGILGHFFTETIGASLLVGEKFEDSESAWARLTTALFRQASGREFSAKKISLNEFKEIKGSWNEETAFKILKLISDKVPAPARSLFDRRSKDFLDTLSGLVKSDKNVEPKFVKIIRWE